MAGIVSGLLGIGCLVVMILGIVFLWRGVPQTATDWYTVLGGAGCIIFGYLFGSAWMRNSNSTEWPKWPFVKIDEKFFGADEE